MILERGDKLLVAHRRLYEGDAARYFLGTVLDFHGEIAKVEGYSWAVETFSGTIVRKEGLRRKLIALASGTHIIYDLDRDVDMDSAEFQVNARGRVLLRDAGTFSLDLTEPVRPAL